MATDLPPNIPICPVAYEVFSPQGNIDSIFSKLSARGLLVGSIIKEEGNVGRFTVFLKSGKEFEFGIFEIIESHDGRTFSVDVVPPALSCKADPNREWMKVLKPSEIVVLLDKSAARKLKIDSIRSGFEISTFREIKKKREVIHFVIPEGIRSYEFSTIVYRMERSDYGNVSFGAVISQKDQADQYKARLEGPKP